jgi:hypothetical protein
MVAPTSPGSATNAKSCGAVKAKPISGKRAATMLNNCHTENPKNSAKIEKIRLRRAVYLPSLSQNSLFSGFHFSIQPEPVLMPAADLVVMR